MKDRLLRDILIAALRERDRRGAEAREELLAELRQMAERMAATAHLGPPLDKDDLSIAERMAIALFLPVPEAERQHHETVVNTWLHEHGYI